MHNINCSTNSSFSKRHQILSVVASVFIIFSFVLPVLTTHAQVDINSQQDPNDPQYYELGDPDSTTTEGDTLFQIDVGVSPTPTGSTVVDSTIPFVRSVQQDFNNIETSIINSNTVPQAFKNVITTIGLPTVTVLALSLTFLPALLSLIPLLISPQLFFLLISALLGEKRNVWGIIGDAETKKPIAFAVVRLYQQDSTAQIDQKVSDLDGKYGFILSEGKYRVEASQSGYQKYVKNITVDKDEQLFAEDIYLSKREANNIKVYLGNFLANLRALTVKYSPYLVTMGFLFSLIAFIAKISLLNVVMIFVYTGMILLYIYLRYRGARSWGVIVDSDSGLKIAGATVRIFDNINSLADTQLSDSRGRFGFFVDPGNYKLLVKASGYKFPSKAQEKIAPSSENKKLLQVDIKKRSWVNVLIKVDPAENSDTDQAQSNQSPLSYTGNKLLSPFSQ